MPEFTRLFEPGMMGKVELKNRIIMAPCGTQLLYPLWNGQ